ncbi:MAG: hypothetical protein HQL43_03875 [Alphaproteobacteria bacterium]|nr:hypothetical protein [Alphaproteobacteria bacterium]
MTKLLHAFYDLEVNPNCFDITKFVCMAELARREEGCDAIAAYIVLAEGHGFRKDDPFEESKRNWRLRNIMMPLLALMPSVTTIASGITRDVAARIMSGADAVFPRGHTMEEPVSCFEWSDVILESLRGKEIPGLVPHQTALAWMRRWVEPRAKGRRTVSITLRETDFEAERNSSLENWLSFARALDPVKYCPIILRDTDKIFAAPDSAFDGLLQCSEVTVNIELRAALYEVCDLNLFVANGPAELCVLNPRTAYVSFFKLRPDKRTGKRPEMHADLALGRKKDFCFAGPHQQLAWGDDTLPAIESAFQRLETSMAEQAEEVSRYKQLDAFPPAKIDPGEAIELFTLSGRTTLVDKLLDHFEDVSKSDVQRWRVQTAFSRCNYPAVVEMSEGFSLDNERAPHVYMMRADALFRSDRQLEALEIYKQLSQSSFLWQQARLRLGMVQVSLEQYEEAAANLEELKAKGFNHRLLSEYLARAYRAMGRNREALDLMIEDFKSDTAQAE